MSESCGRGSTKSPSYPAFKCCLVQNMETSAVAGCISVYLVLTEAIYDKKLKVTPTNRTLFSAGITISLIIL
jgi:hypothetical protein